MISDGSTLIRIYNLDICFHHKKYINPALRPLKGQKKMWSLNTGELQ